MDWLRLFISFNGRIGRATFWLGMGIVFLLSPFALALLFAKTGIITMLGKLGIAGMVWWLLLLYPATALMVKRFRDRQKPVVMALIFTLPALIVIIGSYSAWRDVASAFIGLLNVGLIAILLWFVIELGVYPGRLPDAANKLAAKGPARAKARRA